MDFPISSLTSWGAEFLPPLFWHTKFQSPGLLQLLDDWSTFSGVQFSGPEVLENLIAGIVFSLFGL